MSDVKLPDQLLIIASTPDPLTPPYDARRGSATTLASQLLNAQSVQLSVLQEQVNIFVGQMQEVVNKAPEKVGGFQLAEFEVSAAITIGGKGELNLALLAKGELNGAVNAGLKFVFKRSPASLGQG